MNLEYISNHLPAFELSYDQIYHKKVPNLFIAIPVGKKSLLWFTNFQNEDICILLEYNTKHKKIVSFARKTLLFERELSYGTLAYGTVVSHRDSEYFAMENVFQYCGQNVGDLPFKRKLHCFHEIFSKYTSPYVYTSNEMILSMCIMHKEKEQLHTIIQDQNYPIYGITTRDINSNWFYTSTIEHERPQKMYTFKVKPCIKHNVYELHCYHPDKGIQFYQKSYIPDYVTSVMLNDKFRIIKENVNLDLLEESDDEEDFQNVNDDKYVHTDRYYNYKCYYHKKMKCWVPKVFTHDKKIVSVEEVESCMNESRNYNNNRHNHHNNTHHQQHRNYNHNHNHNQKRTYRKY